MNLYYADMNTLTKTKSEGLRLPVLHWKMMRELMTYHRGRSWLERIILREHEKMDKANASENRL
jgi:hypothetical protein